MTGVGRLPTDSSSSRSYDLIGNLPPSIVSRPEILLEGYHATSQQWLEIPFRYKPDQVNRPPPVNFPHQPRLDWQMWFAALGSYEHNPWLVHLIYQLLQGDSIEVISLLDLERYPFAPSPSHKERPKMIRATLYEMDFTRFNTTWSRNIPLAEILEDKPNHSTSVQEVWRRSWKIFGGGGERKGEGEDLWWQRKRILREYLIPLDLTNPSLKQFLEGNGISLRPYQTLDELETECEIMTESGMMATVRVSQLICSVVFKARRVFEEYSVWNVLWTVLALIGLTEWYSFLKAKRRDQ
jgi:hypothetical protein